MSSKDLQLPKIKQNELDKYSTYDSATHQLTIDKNDWLPDENAFGLIQAECSVVTSKADEMVLVEVNNDLSIGVSEFDVSFAKAVVDPNTGGVVFNGKSVETSYDRNVSGLKYTSSTMSLFIRTAISPVSLSISTLTF